MMFLKLTRSAKSFVTRFGWLIAELIFVFLGLYGAFLLERMHDEEMDQMRKRQILQALVDEFTEYEKELTSASSSLDEGHGVPFFTAYAGGERPFPTPIPFGSMASVNTGIWEAMLQSGGIEVLEVELIQKVQVFFKKLQDLLDLYARFERLSESMILPDLDQNKTFFYEMEGPELRDKYKWYVNSLFTIGMSLRDLSEKAGNTKEVLLTEYDKIRIKKRKEKKADILEKDSVDGIDNLMIEEEEFDETTEESEEMEREINVQALGFLAQESKKLADLLIISSEEMNEKYGMPFLSSYTEGERPYPLTVTGALFESVDLGPLSSVLDADGIDEIVQGEILEPHRTLVIKLNEVQGLYSGFSNRCKSELGSHADSNVSHFYPPEGVEFKERFNWYPNTLYTLVTALNDCSAESTSAFDLIEEMHPGFYDSLEIPAEETISETNSEPVLSTTTDSDNEQE